MSNKKAKLTKEEIEIKECESRALDISKLKGKGDKESSIEGHEQFPVTINEYLQLVEKIAIQEVYGLKSANVLDDGMKVYDVNDGSVIEKSVIKMAQSTMFDRDAWDKTPVDPTLVGRYFNNWDERQYPVTIRRDDIRKIIATGKGASVEEVATEVLDTLTQGEGHEDYINQVLTLQNANFKDFKNNLGGVPSNMKGVLHAIRKAYNHLKANNNDMCSLHEFTCATDPNNIRIGISADLLNLIDVVELAHIFNLEKEELMGKLVIFDLSCLKEEGYTDAQIKLMSSRVFVYDVNAIIKGVRLREITKDESGKGRFTNFYLTVDRLYAHCGLFKGCFINCAEAYETAIAEVVKEPTQKEVTDTLTEVTAKESITSVDLYGHYNNTYTCNEGYNLLGDGAVATVTMGNEIVEGAITISGDGKSCEVNVPLVTDDIEVTLTAVAD